MACYCSLFGTYTTIIWFIDIIITTINIPTIINILHDNCNIIMYTITVPLIYDIPIPSGTWRLFQVASEVPRASVSTMFSAAVLQQLAEEFLVEGTLR